MLELLDKKGSSGAGDEFALPIVDFAFGVAKSFALVNNPAASDELASGGRAKVIYFHFNGGAGVALLQFVDDRATQGSVEHGEDQTAVNQSSTT